MHTLAIFHNAKTSEGVHGGVPEVGGQKIFFSEILKGNGINCQGILSCPAKNVNYHPPLLEEHGLATLQFGLDGTSCNA